MSAGTVTITEFEIKIRSCMAKWPNPLMFEWPLSYYDWPILFYCNFVYVSV